MRKNQWRTFAGLLLLGAMMLVAEWLGRDRANGHELVSSVVTGLAGLGLWMATKSGVEHLAGGGGVKGAVAALTTPAKPEP